MSRGHRYAGWTALVDTARHFGGSSPPKVQEQPPPAPTKTDAEVQAEQARARAAARKRKGRAASILGGEQEAADLAPGTKERLGG